MTDCSAFMESVSLVRRSCKSIYIYRKRPKSGIIVMWGCSKSCSFSINFPQVVAFSFLMVQKFITNLWILYEINTKYGDSQKWFRQMCTMWDFGKYQDTFRTIKKTCLCSMWNNKLSDRNQWIVQDIVWCSLIVRKVTVSCPSEWQTSEFCIATSSQVLSLDSLVSGDSNRTMRIFSVVRIRLWMKF